MKTQFLWTVVAFALAACGNDTANNDFAGTPQLILAALKGGAKPPAPTTASTDDPVIKAAVLRFRDGLQKDGQAVVSASNPSLKYGMLMVPFGGNNGVGTWSSASYQTISLRDGMMVATRGFGPDLMSSALPTTAQVAAARGTTQRRYSYLDGADQPQSYDFTCSLAAAGSESIDVMAKAFATRKVTETCAGTLGRFTNEYWFDHGTNLRQSKQFLAPGLDNMFIQRVID